jgi:hypothetical protein
VGLGFYFNYLVYGSLCVGFDFFFLVDAETPQGKVFRIHP